MRGVRRRGRRGGDEKFDLVQGEREGLNLCWGYFGVLGGGWQRGPNTLISELTHDSPGASSSGTFPALLARLKAR
jgi:hypothetical protein